MEQTALRSTYSYSREVVAVVHSRGARSGIVGRLEHADLRLAYSRLVILAMTSLTGSKRTKILSACARSDRLTQCRAHTELSEIIQKTVAKLREARMIDTANALTHLSKRGWVCGARPRCPQASQDRISPQREASQIDRIQYGRDPAVDN